MMQKKNRYPSNTKFSNKVDQYDQLTKSANLEAQSVLEGPRIGNTDIRISQVLASPVIEFSK